MKRQIWYKKTDAWLEREEDDLQVEGAEKAKAGR